MGPETLLRHTPAEPWRSAVPRLGASFGITRSSYWYLPVSLVKRGAYREPRPTNPVGGEPMFA